MDPKTVNSIILGIYQAYTFAGPPAGLILIVSGHTLIGISVLAASALAVYGWGTQFNFRKRP